MVRRCRWATDGCWLLNSDCLLTSRKQRQPGVPIRPPSRWPRRGGARGAQSPQRVGRHATSVAPVTGRAPLRPRPRWVTGLCHAPRRGVCGGGGPPSRPPPAHTAAGKQVPTTSRPRPGWAASVEPPSLLVPRTSARGGRTLASDAAGVSGSHAPTVSRCPPPAPPCSAPVRRRHLFNERVTPGRAAVVCWRQPFAPRIPSGRRGGCPTRGASRPVWTPRVSRCPHRLGRGDGEQQGDLPFPATRRAASAAHAATTKGGQGGTGRPWRRPWRLQPPLRGSAGERQRPNPPDNKVVSRLEKSLNESR